MEHLTPGEYEVELTLKSIVFIDEGDNVTEDLLISEARNDQAAELVMWDWRKNADN